MRTLGDLQWINDYVGIPYLFAGRGMDGADCYGLCKLLYHNEYSIDLPDWTEDRVDLRGRDKAIAEAVTGGHFTETDDPQDGDFVVCYKTKIAHHIGLYYAGGVLHAANGIGSIYEPLSRFKRNYVRVVFGSWEP